MKKKISIIGSMVISIMLIASLFFVNHQAEKNTALAQPIQKPGFEVGALCMYAPDNFCIWFLDKDPWIFSVQGIFV